MTISTIDKSLQSVVYFCIDIMNRLTDSIKEEQKRRTLTDTELAKLLGIDRSTWAYIKSGKRNPGVKFLKALAREFPALKALIDEEIYGMLADIPTDAHQTHQDGKIGRFKTWCRVLVLRAREIWHNRREL